MNFDGALPTVLLVLLCIAAPAQNAFVLIYGLRTPWWRSLIGRALFTKALGLALFLDLALLFQWFGDYDLRDYFRFVVYSLVALGSWLQLIAFLKNRRAAREAHEPF